MDNKTKEIEVKVDELLKGLNCKEVTDIFIKIFQSLEYEMWKKLEYNGTSYDTDRNAVINFMIDHPKEQKIILADIRRLL